MGNGAGSASMAALTSAAMAGAKRKLDECDPMKTDVKKVRRESFSKFPLQAKGRRDHANYSNHEKSFISIVTRIQIIIFSFMSLETRSKIKSRSR